MDKLTLSDSDDRKQNSAAASAFCSHLSGSADGLHVQSELTQGITSGTWSAKALVISDGGEHQSIRLNDRMQLEAATGTANHLAHSRCSNLLLGSKGTQQRPRGGGATFCDRPFKVAGMQVLHARFMLFRTSHFVAPP